MAYHLTTIAASAATGFGREAVWTAIVQIFILAAALLVGNLLRRKIPFMRKSLIPSALLGGTIILLLKLIPAVNDFISVEFMETLTYHCLAIGFIAMALRKRKKENSASTKTVLESGVLQGGVYVLQAMLGLGISIALYYACNFFPAGGILLALGFGQGPGQALNFGSSFETDYNFDGGGTFGLTIATIGFFVASIVGVVYLNVLRKKGKLRVLTKEDYVVAERLSDYVGENEIPNTESVDKLTINVGLILFIYGLVYLVMRLVNVNLIWGFNFLLGSIFALLARLLMNFLGKKKVIRRELTNNYVLDRVSGLMFDTMIIAGVAAIDIHKLSALWWQILVICTVGAVATFVYIRRVSNHIYKGYENEGFFSMFGMLTGTASNGMILLREIDPKYETPAASNLVLSGVPAIAFGGGLLLLLNYCPKGITECWVTFAVLVAAFTIFTLILFRSKIFKRKGGCAKGETAEAVAEASEE